LLAISDARGSDHTLNGDFLREIGVLRLTMTVSAPVVVDQAFSPGGRFPIESGQILQSRRERQTYKPA
jgi:hypothetical protein